MRIHISLVLILLGSPLAMGQTSQPAFDASQVFNVYSKPPATQPVLVAEELRNERFYQVSEPTLYVWPAAAGTANGTAIIACPGGSYDHITMEAEGHAIAKWLNPMGITVLGLKYRTRPPSTDVAADALLDGQRAVRLVRSRAKEFNINPDRIGVLGYSAGANLVLNLASHFDRGMAHGTDAVDLVSCRPDFAVMLSTWPNRQTIDKFPLSPDSPPTFIAIAKDDRTAPPPFTAQIKAKLDEAKVPTQLYEAERGGHGAFHLDGPGVDTGWKQPFLDWMKKNKWL
jgi:acetyl esterase/lipase